MPHFTLPKGSNCAEGMKKGRYMGSAPDPPQSSQSGFLKAESKSSSPSQEPHQCLNLDVTPQKCDKCQKNVTFPASNENFHEMASAEELMGRNIPFSYPKKEARGTRDLLQDKRWRGHVTPNMQKWKSRNIAPIPANQHHLIQPKWQ